MLLMFYMNVVAYRLRGLEADLPWIPRSQVLLLRVKLCACDGQGERLHSPFYLLD